MNITIRRVYLYLTSLIGLVLVLIGGVQLINLGLKTYIFTKADYNYYGACPLVAPTAEGEQKVDFVAKQNCEKEMDNQRTARRQNQAANAIAMILVGAPVWMYHWRKVKDERDA